MQLLVRDIIYPFVHQLVSYHYSSPFQSLPLLPSFFLPNARSQITEKIPKKNPRIPHFHLLRLNRSARATFSTGQNSNNAIAKNKKSKSVSSMLIFILHSHKLPNVRLRPCVHVLQFPGFYFPVEIQGLKREGVFHKSVIEFKALPRLRYGFP